MGASAPRPTPTNRRTRERPISPSVAAWAAVNLLGLKERAPRPRDRGPPLPSLRLVIASPPAVPSSPARGRTKNGPPRSVPRGGRPAPPVPAAQASHRFIRHGQAPRRRCRRRQADGAEVAAGPAQVGQLLACAGGGAPVLSGGASFLLAGPITYPGGNRPEG